jgi:hypothetical protein
MLCLFVAMTSCRKSSVETQPTNDAASAAAPAPTAPPVIAEAPSPPNTVEQSRPPLIAASKEAHSPSPVIAADMPMDFQDAFNDLKECRGIQVSNNAKATKPVFKVYTVFGTADTPEMEEQWRWTVFDLRRDPNGEFLGAGNETSAENAMRNVCRAVWGNFSPDSKPAK